MNIVPNGLYVDLTYGGGGHSRAILEQLGADGHLYAFDKDADALQNHIDDHRLTLIHQNFEHAADYLLALGVEQIDGALADLGVSSHQLDEDDCGFSYRENVLLDMRMDKRQTLRAMDILNSYSTEQLQLMFQELGEVRNSKTLAQMIVRERVSRPFEMSQDLNDLLLKIKFGTFESYAAPIYQSLRMEVNDEIGVLKRMLTSITSRIKTGGRLCVITFHSLEDRIVKNFMKYGTFDPHTPTDIYGRAAHDWNWKMITKKPILASIDEVKENKRSRSAKLRVIEKIKDN